MMALLDVFWTPASEDDAATDERLRAAQTLHALSALLGSPMPEKDSVASWSNKQLRHHYQEILAAPMVQCPPYRDPTSIAIVDSRSLEFQLQEDSAPTKSTKIAFDESVTIVTIPSHHQVDFSTKQRLWSSSEEIHEHGFFASLEYHADGRDWRNVLEEEDMIWDASRQDYVHPATLEYLEAVQREVDLEKEHAAMEAAIAEERKRKQRRLQRLQQQQQQEESRDRSPQRQRRRNKNKSNNKQRRHQHSSSSSLHNLPKGLHTIQEASLTRFADS